MSQRIELFPLTLFPFLGAPPSTQEVQLIKFVPTNRFVSGIFEVRVAARTLNSSQFIRFVLQPISMAEDEPQATYTTTTNEIVAAVDSGTSPAAVPGLVTANLTAPVPAYYRLIVRAIQHPTVATAMSVQVSASLTLRES